jgi:arsenate reductase
LITIYHNPRCSKSRETYEIIASTKKAVTVVKYLDDLISEEKLKEIISMLDIKPIELVRTQEAIWKEHFKNKQLSDDEVIQAMLTYPKLIERPIVINGNKAVIGRPPSIVLDII